MGRVLASRAVVGVLGSSPEKSRKAASALGTCGRLAAIESLTKRLERAEREDLRRSLLLSIGLSRDPTAIQFLISRLESPSDTQAALEGLRPACVYQETQSRVQETLQKLGDPLLIKEFERRFGRGDR